MLQRQPGSTIKPLPTWQHYLKHSIDLPSVSSIDWPSAEAPLTTVEPPRLSMTATEFIESTYLEVIDDRHAGVAPFHLWEGQKTALAAMEQDKLAVFLKARQLGISWIVCGFALYSGLLFPNQTVLAYSQGQLEANELIRRTSFLYHQHQRRDELPRLVRDNTGLLQWDNGFRMLSLAATRRAGRSFTASIAILDEWAFMAWPRQTLAAVKPTIDAGGKLFIISSADGQGSAYHQFWQHAVSGKTGYKAVFLPWFSHPDRGEGWREQKILEANGDTASVLREYPANDIEAFTAAAGLVYDIWSDGPPDGNVTEDADYQEGAGPIFWAVDDGYSGALDPQTGYFTAGSAPRVILFCQELANGDLNFFDEQYKVHTMEEDDITSARARGYPDPVYAAVDSASAALRGRLQISGIYTRGKPQHIDESVKVTRRMLAKDTNGRRRIHVHPRCTYLRREMASYRNDDKGDPIDDVNHGPDALRYLAWTKRNEL